MSFFSLDFKKIIILIPIIGLPLLSMNMQKHPLEQRWTADPFQFLAGVIQGSYFSFSQTVQGTTATYLNLLDIKTQNSQLLSENSELKAQLTILDELRLENARLNQLFEFKQQSKMSLIAAKVVGRDVSVDHATILINRGTQDGIRHGMAVITTHGAIGYVFRPSAYTSFVLLLTDRYSVIDGIVQRSRSRGIVEGKNGKSASLKYVSKSEDVVAGDLVVSSGLDNIFPKGLPVARVNKVTKREYDISLQVELEPVVDPNKAEELFVVLNANHQDLMTDIASLPSSENNSLSEQSAE